MRWRKTGRSNSARRVDQQGSPGAAGRRSAIRFFQGDAKLYIGLEIDQGGPKLLDDPVQAVPININRLANSHLETVLRTIVLRGEMDAPSGSQHPEQLLQHQQRSANVFERFVEHDEVDTTGLDVTIEIVLVKIDNRPRKADGFHPIDRGFR